MNIRSRRVNFVCPRAQCRWLGRRLWLEDGFGVHADRGTADADLSLRQVDQPVSVGTEVRP